jgi:predicted deacylase
VEFFDQPTPVGAATYDAATASGFRDLIALPPSLGVLQTALAQTGVPVIEGEVGGLGETRPDNVRYYKQRVAAVARHAGILPAPERSPAAGAPRIWHLCPVETVAGGMFVRQVSLGDSVRAGDEMGALYDVQGDKADIVRAPRDGVVGGCRIHAGVRPGDRLFTLWTRAVPQLASR